MKKIKIIIGILIIFFGFDCKTKDRTDYRFSDDDYWHPKNILLMRSDSFICKKKVSQNEILCLNLTHTDYSVKYKLDENKEIVEATGFKGIFKECFDVSFNKEHFYIEDVLIY